MQLCRLAGLPSWLSLTLSLNCRLDLSISPSLSLNFSLNLSLSLNLRPSKRNGLESERDPKQPSLLSVAARLTGWLAGRLAGWLIAFNGFPVGPVNLLRSDSGEMEASRVAKLNPFAATGAHFGSQDRNSPSRYLLSLARLLSLDTCRPAAIPLTLRLHWAPLTAIVVQRASAASRVLEPTRNDA